MFDNVRWPIYLEHCSNNETSNPSGHFLILTGLNNLIIPSLVKALVILKFSNDYSLITASLWLLHWWQLGYLDFLVRIFTISKESNWIPFQYYFKVFSEVTRFLFMLKPSTCIYVFVYSSKRKIIVSHLPRIAEWWSSLLFVLCLAHNN